MPKESMPIRQTISAARTEPFLRRAVGPLVGLLVLWWEVPCYAFSTLSKAEDQNDLLSQLKELKDEEDELKQYMETLVRPKLTCFQAFGKTYKLPLRNRIASKFPTAAELAYLGGFFDGDGCVTHESCLSGCKLQITQLAINAEVLILFRQFLGGSICAKDQGRGMRQPTLQWVIYGGKAKTAARQLSKVCLSKAEQLQLAINWPSEKDARQLVADKLQQLKRTPPNIPSQSKFSWALLAGLFDSDGCIYLSQKRCSWSLIIVQKYKVMLLRIKVFLNSTLGTSIAPVHVYACGAGHELRVNAQKAVKIILQELLNAGLTVKAEAALCACAPPLCEGNHASVREQLSSLTTGNQGRYTRLDAQGCLRAKHIDYLQSRKRYAQKIKDSKSVEQLQSELERLQLRHKIENGKCRVQLLTEDIKKLLAQDATSTKPHLAEKLGFDFDLIRRPRVLAEKEKLLAPRVDC